MIVVTGAAGFIGTNLARRLAGSCDATVLLVDRAETAARVEAMDGLGSARFLDHLSFLDTLRGGGADVEAVFHLGACSDTTEADWDYLKQNNLEYSQHLWRWCAKRGVPFVYASSAATYGDGSDGFDDRTPSARLRPLNLYGKSKNDFDVWVADQVAAGEPTPKGWSGLKFFNVYGPYETHKGRMASMVWHAYRQIAERGEVRLFRSTDPAYADGGQLRDFVFVEDNVDHMLWLWKNPDVCGVFNSGTGQARSFNDLVTAAFDAMGIPPRIRYIEMPADLRGRYQSYTRAETSKLREAGYDCRPTPLEQGVSRYVEWLERTRLSAGASPGTPPSH